MDKPDYNVADYAGTNDGRVTAQMLIDIAFELRTANLIAYHAQIGHVDNELASRIEQRLGIDYFDE